METPDGFIVLETLGAQRCMIELLDLVPQLLLSLAHIPKHRAAVGHQDHHQDTAHERQRRHKKHACLQWQPQPRHVIQTSELVQTLAGTWFARRLRASPSLAGFCTALLVDLETHSRGTETSISSPSFARSSLLSKRPARGSSCHSWHPLLVATDRNEDPMLSSSDCDTAGRIGARW